MTAALLDTHAFLWLVQNDPQLSRAARERIEQPGIELFLSFASAWEIAIKYRLGKLALPGRPEAFVVEQCEVNRIRLLPISLRAIFVAGEFPLHHRDPFDRLLAAQCHVASLPILSADVRLDAYGIERVW